MYIKPIENTTQLIYPLLKTSYTHLVFIVHSKHFGPVWPSPQGYQKIKFKSSIKLAVVTYVTMVTSNHVGIPKKTPIGGPNVSV